MQLFGFTVLTTGEHAQLEAWRAQLERDRASAQDACAALRAHLAAARELTAAATARAEAAESMMREQRRSIDQLMASNERMVSLVSTMHRTGLGILADIETSDTPATVAEYDREAVVADPDLEAEPD